MSADRPADWTQGAELVWLPTAEEMAGLDRDAVEAGHADERTLIEAAGREVARELQRRWPAGPVLGLVGSGHNGADALVALRTLAAWGREVRAVLGGGSPPEPDVRAGWELPLAGPESLAEAASGAVVAVDGLLGTGVRGAPREPQASLLTTLDALPLPVLAVDGPSGIDFTTGAVPGACVRAACTVALGWPKLGLLRHPGRGRCGEIVVVEIGFPPAGAAGARAITGRWVRRLLPERPADAHKGDAGYLTLVAGQRGMAGASVLAARSATRGGAGIVRVVGDPANREIVQASVPEALFASWEDGEELAGALDWAHAVAMGPGLGRGPARSELVEEVLERRGERPLVLDADGLNVWEGRLDALADVLAPPAVLTPHPGELARLTGRSIAEILEDPPGHARETARRLGVPVLLKGAPSVLAPPDGPVRVSTTGGSVLATGGSGDVLTGLIGAYLAAGLGPLDAATSALFVSGLAAARSGRPGSVSGDFPRAFPEVVAAVEALPEAAEGPLLFRQEEG